MVEVRLAITAIEGPRTTVRSLSIWPLASSHTPHLTHFKLPLDPASRPGVRPTIISSISSVQHKVHSWFYWFFAVKSINYHQLVVSNVSKCNVDVNIQHTNVHIGIRLTFRSIINELYDLNRQLWLRSPASPGSQVPYQVTRPWADLERASTRPQKKDLSCIEHRHRHPSIPTFASLTWMQIPSEKLLCIKSKSVNYTMCKPLC